MFIFYKKLDTLPLYVQKMSIYLQYVQKNQKTEHMPYANFR